MDSISTQTWIILAGVLVLAVIALLGWSHYRKRQAYGLQQRFGAEYGGTVQVLGTRTEDEAELRARQKRVEPLHIVALQPAEAVKFSQAWKVLQRRFVDNPKGVVVQADRLGRELMLARGYPMGDFERRAGDVSVDHPAVVANYRAAQAIALRAERGEANTEDLRKAVVHYRALFAELLEVTEAREVPMQQRHKEVQS
jgi:hypothetical protein